MATFLGLPFYVSLYQGLRESWKFQYYAPKLSKKVKGNSGWMEVRYRHPSPANAPVNEQAAAREHLRHHFKTPYPYSRYYVRNFWDPIKEGGKFSIVKVLPELSQFTPKQEARFLNYIQGDDLGNKTKRDFYEKYAKKLMSENNPKE